MQYPIRTASSVLDELRTRGIQGQEASAAEVDMLYFIPGEEACTAPYEYTVVSSPHLLNCPIEPSPVLCGVLRRVLRPSSQAVSPRKLVGCSYAAGGTVVISSLRYQMQRPETR